MAEHALLSASSAYRWLKCTAAPRFEQQFPDSSSVYALEGTIAHAIGEYCLKHDIPALEVTADEVPIIHRLKEVYPEADDKELESELTAMQRHVQGYVDYCMAIPGQRYVETRVSYAHLVPEGFGTSDFIAVNLNGEELDVVDLKYGKGKKVFADGEQGKLYGIGTVAELETIFDKLKTIRLHIYQPRLDHVDVHEMTVAELLAWGVEYVAPRAEKAYSGQGEFVAGDHCDFCRARFECKARTAFNLAIAKADFEEPCPTADMLTMDDWAALLPNLPSLAKWAEEMQAHALEMALDGQVVPGYKIVEGRSTRKWVDEVAAADAMREAGLSNEQIYTMKLIGMTETEKLLGKKSDIFELAQRVPGKPTLVPLSDKREPIGVSSAARDFAE